MPYLEGKRAFLELCAQEGIEFIFGNPGTTELALMDALATEERIRYVLGLQEAAVMGIADGYGQASGRLAAVNLHAAPGLGNALGMLHNAKKAGTPLLVTAGQQNLEFALTEPLLWDDLASMARPLVKWSAEVTSLQDLPRALHRAAKTALAPPTGPVFLSIPGNILTDAADIDLMAPSRVAPGLRGDASAIERAAALLAASEAPMIFAGDAVAQRRAHACAIRLAELIGAPVYAESLPSTASFPSSHPLFAGTIERLAPAARAVLDPHDLILSIGGDLFTQSMATGMEPIPPQIPIIHIDLDPWQLAKNYPVEVAILGDPAAVLPELVQATEKKLVGAASGRAERRREAVIAALAGKRADLLVKVKRERDAKPLRPLPLLHALGEALPGNAVVIEEALSSAPRLRELIRSDDPQSFFGMRGGGIGWGFAATVGVKLALPERPVVAITGDGSALYTIQALWTAAHEKLSTVFVILNNRSYRILKQRTKAMRGYAAQTGNFVAMDLRDPPVDFVKLAESFGARAVAAETIDEVLAAVADGFAHAGPTLIDVAIDPEL
ncbi:benzoylformate decarboxylase [Rhizobiales bacterium GAS191]|jgi:benzoylformate decarboxylase|nr:benzoylformate decarboxylase [Rhizobiales bacterium GAS113]SEB77552.1 benzoylformate decarboxylase [Rhizobiales bacterium GAS188]SED50145.1 benzoylformate decarboxylase [Rhizobiales bacterium GAS191]